VTSTGLAALDHLLHCGWIGPDGRPRACPVRAVLIGRGLAGKAVERVEQAGLAGPFAVLADENTAPIMGEGLARALRARLLCLSSPQAAVEVAEALLPELSGVRTVVAAGSGTLNDLAKYAAWRAGAAACVFATAPSMNGWVTATASLSRGGLKETIPVPPPRAAFFDLDVLAAAPLRLRRAGIGDALCRSSVELDLWLQHLLLGARFPARAMALQREVEAVALAHLPGMVEGKPEAIRALVWWLLAGSFAMLMEESSAPASQGEHAISHHIDVFARPRFGALHGEQVALATRHTTHLAARLLDGEGPPRLAPLRLDDGALEAAFGPHAGAARAAVRAKGLDDPERVSALQRKLAERWAQLRHLWRTTCLSAQRFAELSQQAGLPEDPVQLGIGEVVWKRALRWSFALRGRFGILDLAALAEAAATSG